MKKWCIAMLSALVLATTVIAPVSAADKPKLTPEERFKRLDKNSDGKLDLTEFKGKAEGDKVAMAEKRFKALDKDGDGFVSLEEFKVPPKKAK